jgi:hypothetical protein
MSKVYRHIPMAADAQLGRVEPDGRVFETRFGPDKQMGRVDVDSGKIFATRVGPDQQVGRVALDTGKVYRTKFGPDEYVGRVDEDGKFHRHKPVALDEYIGRMVEMPTLAHGGAALLLLALPAWEELEAERDAAEARAKTEAEAKKAARDEAKGAE